MEDSDSAPGVGEVDQSFLLEGSLSVAKSRKEIPEDTPYPRKRKMKTARDWLRSGQARLVLSSVWANEILQHILPGHSYIYSVKCRTFIEIA